MSVQSGRQFRVGLPAWAALAGLAAACAGAGPSHSSIGETPAPAKQTCLLVVDSNATTADTIRYVAESGPAAAASPSSVAPCADTASGVPPTVDSIPVPRGADLRDFLDRANPAPGAPQVDVLVTRNPDVLSYAAQLGTYRGVALPWDRTYVLVAPNFDSTTTIPTPAQRDALARDAVQADARGAQPPFWWEHDTTCATGAPRWSSGAPRIVGYAADDPIGRQLAERIVALASAQGTPSWIPAVLASPTQESLRTMPFAPTALNDALASGQVAAFVTALPRTKPAVCSPAVRVPAGAIVVPLVDSRAHALLRRGSGAAFYIEGNGALRFVSRRVR
ncbi:MAG: hypothetical protein ACRDG3_13900 [Tepidiformaceae bacterium]